MRVKNALYILLMHTWRFWRRFDFMHKVWKKITTPAFDVVVKIHNVPVSIPSTHAYPLITRWFPAFNNPFLQLVYQVNTEKKRKICVADIGAGIGDTFLLIESNLPGSVHLSFCVEGDAHFFNYLEKNLASFPQCILANLLLSDKTEKISSLVRIHPSTNSAQGQQEADAFTLDEKWTDHCKLPPDVIKIDTDGFDGKIIAGAKELLLKYQPALIFEYHPLLYIAAKSGLDQPFIVLAESGYMQLIWFDKFGRFSHLSKTVETEINLQYAEECIAAGAIMDQHYDIIALPAGSPLSIKELSECNFARTKKFPY